MRINIISETTQDQLSDIASRLIHFDKYPNFVHRRWTDHESAMQYVASICKKTAGGYWKWFLNQWYKSDDFENFSHDLWGEGLPTGDYALPEAFLKYQLLLNKFDSNKHLLEKKDINQYKDYEELANTLDKYSELVPSKKTVDYRGLLGVDIVHKNGPNVTLKVDNADSLSKLGAGTKWCTREDYPDCQAERYMNKHYGMYVLLINDRPALQYTPDYKEVKDINDENVVSPKLLRMMLPPSPALYDLGPKYISRGIQYQNLTNTTLPELQPYLQKMN